MASGTNIKYRPDIDGLRAIAVLSVVGFHAFPDWVQGGFIGVDVFFVISGFLISTLIFQGIEQKTFSYMHFYSRRIKRLFPALIIMLIGCLFFCWLLALPSEMKLIGKHIAGGALSISNLILARESGYFDVHSNLKPLLHLWSLGVEEQYYLIWPLLVSVIFKRLRRFLPIFLFLLILSFFLNVYFIKTYPSRVFYFPITRAWELLIGALIAYMAVFHSGIVNLIRQRLPLGSILSLRCHELLAWLGAILVFFALFLLNKNDIFPGWVALLPTVGAFMIISAGPTAWFNQTILANRLLVFIGVISYPIYLWHWPLLVFTRIIRGEDLPIIIRTEIIIVSFILAWLTYKLVEKPIQSGKVAGTPILLLISVALIGILGIYTSNLTVNMLGDHSKLYNDLVYNDKALHYQTCPSDLKNANPKLKYCSASSAITPTAVVFGDSHADHLFPGISKFDIKHGWLLAGNPMCPPVNGILVEANVPLCQKKSENILKYIESNDTIQTVVLSFFGGYFKNKDFSADHIQNHNGPSIVRMSINGNQTLNKTQVFWYGLNNTITALERAGKKIVIVADVPELPFFPKNCLSRPLKYNTLKDCFVSKQIVLDRQAQLRKGLNQIKQHHPDLRIFDPADFLCDQKNCYAKINGVLVYRDSHHLSIRGSELFARHFFSWLSAKDALLKDVS